MILKLFGHRSYTYLNSLCDNSEEETPDDNLAHVLEAVGDCGLDAVLHDLTDRERGKATAHVILHVILRDSCACMLYRWMDPSAFL